MQDNVAFGVLGPMELRSEQGPLAVGEPRRRSVLAALLLESGRTVPLGRLAGLIWGDSAPATSRKAIQVYISQLRRILADLPDVEVTTQRDGYSLICPPDLIDLHLFRRLVTQAQAEHAPARRRALLTQALGLWRGPAFADIGGEGMWAHITAAIEEERLAALEDLYEAELRLGNQTAVLGALRQLTAEHPLRERMAGLLMTALHRCGRSTEAAEVFRVFRQRLVGDTGMEPSRVLASLHRNILAGEATMPPPSPSAPEGTRRDLVDSIGRLASSNVLALLEIGDRHVAEGDYDRAMACYYGARALARDNGEDTEVERATRGISYVGAFNAYLYDWTGENSAEMAPSSPAQ